MLFRLGPRTICFSLAALLWTAEVNANLIKFIIGNNSNETSNKSGDIVVNAVIPEPPFNCPLDGNIPVGQGIAASIAANEIGNRFDQGACALAADVDVAGNMVTVHEATDGFITHSAGLYSDVEMTKMVMPPIGPPPVNPDIPIGFPVPDPGSLAIINKGPNGADVPILTRGILRLALQIDTASSTFVLPFDVGQSTADINSSLDAVFSSGFVLPTGINYLGLVEGFPTFGAPFDYDFAVSQGVDCLDADGSLVDCGPLNDPGFVLGAMNRSIPEPGSFSLVAIWIVMFAVRKGVHA